MILHLFGPIAGRRNDMNLLQQSGFHVILTAAQANLPQQIDVYTDKGYVPMPFLVCAHKMIQGRPLTVQQQLNNDLMKSIRSLGAEFPIGDITSFEKYLDYSHQLKAGNQPIGKYYVVAALLKNAHTCLYGCNTAEVFHAMGPTLEQYFQ